MIYKSTRSNDYAVSPSAAIVKGICGDGGIFVPVEIPAVNFDLQKFSSYTYKEMAYEILKLYITDFSKEELLYCIDNAYDEKFDVKEITPLREIGGEYILELFHGKTLAFKDMALSILPYLLNVAAQKNALDKDIVILVATSGDTGKAALEGFKDVAGTKIIVFFPEEGVSPVQRLQMTTQEGKNTCVVGIKGNFDDAQSAVKDIFTDETIKEFLLEKGFVFSSANSINIGRLIPQIVYYFYAYVSLYKSGGIKEYEKINFTVPTGNFGNILAAYYAKEMGLPINKLICASNENKVLYDFFNTGVYDKNRAFVLTASPSMDILISSNLERLLYHMAGCEKTKQWMESLKNCGCYSLEETTEDFVGEFATDAETFAGIKKVYEESGYILDTHTSVAYCAYEKYKNKTKDSTKNIIISTASPFKFTKDVMTSIDKKYKEKDVFALMEELAKKQNISIPAQIKDINRRKILHKNVCKREDIKQFVKNYFI